MTATNEFFIWFYYGLGGLGGWFIFLLLALVGVIWLLYDSSRRRLPALGWRLAVILTGLLILPAVLYRFTVDPINPVSATSPLYPYSELIFYLGLLGGVLPAVIAVGYYVTFQGLVGCDKGHVYEAALGQCPECARLAVPVPPPQIIRQAAPRPMPMPVPPNPPLPVPKPKAHAWLISKDGRDYQLNLSETTIGRSSENDIQLSGDTTVSRQHAKVTEQNGHFRLIDMGSDNYTRVNGHVLRQPILLQPDDEIQFGDNTVVQFVTSRH
jgi:hypothetical protein